MSKTVVITGASTGIGRALALELARRGYNLGLTARRQPVLEAVRDEICSLPGASGIRLEIAALDVTQVSQVAITLEALFARLGGVDIVVANAGANDLTRVGRGDLEKQVNLIQTNVVGAIATVDAAAAHFIKCGAGHVVGISSLASLQALPKQAAYCASKAAFSMYLDSARLELKRKGICVTKIMPGFIKTDIVKGVDIAKMPFAVSVEQAARELADLIEKRVAVGIVPAFPWKWLRPFFGYIPERFMH